MGVYDFDQQPSTDSESVILNKDVASQKLKSKS